MPRPTARVLTLLELLQSGGTRTAAELAERLDVDERRHEVILWIRGTAEQIRVGLPASVAIVEEPRAAGRADGDSELWSRVERLDWLPPVLASFDLPFVIERPDELRDLVVALADWLVDSARRSPPDVRPVP
ncbi:hypothetical protein ACFXMT_27305 [Streptomyces mirabilis]|uniref:hypothetical protein n=1 Tax=Streptomyces mirabilis TaxID=68239 RepID=UPI003662F6DC